MNTWKALTIAMFLLAGATARTFLAPSKIRNPKPEQTTDLKESEDPFADMIEEGDGLLVQRKAAAAEAARKGRTV